MSPREIVRAVTEIERKMQEEKNRHNQTMVSLCGVLAELRGKCKHPLSSFYPDPAGGSDSFRECDLCGDTLPAFGG